MSTLLQVRPYRPAGDLMDVHRVDSERQPDAFVVLTAREPLSDLADIGIGQPAVAVVLTARFRPAFASLGPHVSVVVGLRTNEQVGRPDARRIIAAVQDVFMGRNGADAELP